MKYPTMEWGKMEAVVNKLGGMEGVERFLRGELILKEAELLELVSTIVLSATTGKFIAREKFRVNTKHNAKVLISAVWDNFTEWFLLGDGKTEDPISEQTLRYHKLRQRSVDGPIIIELGGEDQAETTLSELFALLEMQGQGQAGILLNNGWANVFYIRDQNGVLRTVYVYWYGDGWGVVARSVEDPYGWLDGIQVFSRNK